MLVMIRLARCPAGLLHSAPMSAIRCNKTCWMAPHVEAAGTAYRVSARGAMWRKRLGIGLTSTRTLSLASLWQLVLFSSSPSSAAAADVSGGEDSAEQLRTRNSDLRRTMPGMGHLHPCRLTSNFDLSRRVSRWDPVCGVIAFSSRAGGHQTHSLLDPIGNVKGSCTGTASWEEELRPLLGFGTHRLPIVMEIRTVHDMHDQRHMRYVGRYMWHNDEHDYSRQPIQ